MSHENKVVQLQETLSEHKQGPVPTKGLPLQNYIEKENYLQYEVCIPTNKCSYISIIHQFCSMGVFVVHPSIKSKYLTFLF